jgi:tripartite-type tricarboxylate transporter receptor subunit TctC
VTSAQRSPILPDVPTIAEGGLPGYEFTSWFGVLAPRGTASERVVALNGHMRNALRTPEVAQRLLREGAEVVASTPDDFAKFLRVELAKWARVVKEAGLKAE